jgi:hypothetical protein
MGNYFFLLLILACPLMMVFMMRGHRGHGADRANGGSADGHTAAHVHSDSTASADELRRRRAKLDDEIEARDALETRVGGDRR